jgi:hypothetical protein
VRLVALILLAATPALGAVPQAEREANVYERARARHETPPVVQVVPQVQINVYTPTFIAPGYGYPAYVSPLYGGYGNGRPAWPPSW